MIDPIQALSTAELRERARTMRGAGLPLTNPARHAMRTELFRRARQTLTEAQPRQAAAQQQSPAPTLTEVVGEPIHVYDRAAALDDGVLVAARADLLENAGIRYPLAYTAAVHADCIAWSDNYAAYQDEAGREWDVLYMLATEIRRRRVIDTGRISFRLLRIPPTATAQRPTRTELIAQCGPGDLGEPVITVTQPGDS